MTYHVPGTDSSVFYVQPDLILKAVLSFEMQVGCYSYHEDEKTKAEGIQVTFQR